LFAQGQQITLWRSLPPCPCTTAPTTCLATALIPSSLSLLGLECVWLEGGCRWCW
jgi:hypothetical protein